MSLTSPSCSAIFFFIFFIIIVPGMAAVGYSDRRFISKVAKHMWSPHSAPGFSFTFLRNFVQHVTWYARVRHVHCLARLARARALHITNRYQLDWVLVGARIQEVTLSAANGHVIQRIFCKERISVCYHQ